MPDALAGVETLDQYLEKYGPLLGEQARKNLAPLYVPGQDDLHPRLSELLRTPYAPQAAAITGAAAALRRQKALLLIGECGVGKTIMGQATVHCHADGRSYTSLVMAPGQLTRKWKRELEETLPGVSVQIIERCSELLLVERCWRAGLYRNRQAWFIIGRDTAKLGHGKRAAAVIKRQNVGGELGVRRPHCPKCGEVLTEQTKEGSGISYLTMEDLQKKLQECFVCGEPLWQAIPSPRRFEPAKYLHKKMRGFLDYLIIDEAHEEKSPDSAQANAMGSLAASAKKVIAMTGTLIGGYAEHIRTLLWRLAPRTLVQDGLSWKDSLPFSERYGRIEVRTTEKESSGESNRQSRGSKKTSSKYIRPGIVPSLFGNHLIGNSVFLGLDEMEGNLPPLLEEARGVAPHARVSSGYEKLEKDLKERVSEMVRKGDRRLLSAMLVSLMLWPDHPFGWDAVGYDDRGTFVPCAWPENLDPDIIYPKEQELIDICQSEHALGRQVWVYVQFNGAKDVEGRLQRVLSEAGLRVGVLKAKVPLKDREAWIARNGKDVDVMLSHPRLVETGLDLFDKGFAGHNFCTLVFYETGYVLPTLRQASRRAWRLQQPKECKVLYLYYTGTMQERAMALMGKKLIAAEALEGKFSSEGLVALAGDDGLEMALAKSLVGNIQESADRSWGKASRAGRARRVITLEEVT